MTPGAGFLVVGCGHISHIVKMHYFFKNLLSTPKHRSDKLDFYSNDSQGRVYQNCNFHDPRGRGFCARVWLYKSVVKMHYFFKNLSPLLPGIEQTN